MKPTSASTSRACFGGMAELAALEGGDERAALFFGKSQELFSEIGAAVDPDGAETQERILRQLYEELGEERTNELPAQGAASSVEELSA
jgi:hypothetical protein